MVLDEFGAGMGSRIGVSEGREAAMPFHPRSFRWMPTTPQYSILWITNYRNKFTVYGSQLHSFETAITVNRKL